MAFAPEPLEPESTLKPALELGLELDSEPEPLELVPELELELELEPDDPEVDDSEANDDVVKSLIVILEVLANFELVELEERVVF